MAVQDLALLREMIEHPLEMLHAVTDMACLVLHYEAENPLVYIGGREKFAEGVGVAQMLERHLVHRARLHQAMAGSQGALAKDLGMARLVHRLSRYKRSDLDKLRVEAWQPHRRRIGCDHFDFGEKRHQLR